MDTPDELKRDSYERLESELKLTKSQLETFKQLSHSLMLRLETLSKERDELKLKQKGS